MKTKILITLILFIIISCGDNRDRVVIDMDNVPLKHFTVIDSLVINELFQPINIHVVGNYIVMNTLAQQGDTKAFYLYNKENMKFLGKYQFFGKASNEILDLDPYYFYNTSDSTFLTHTNYVYETEFLIKNDSIIRLKSECVSNVVPANIYRISNNKHVVNPMENEKDFEFIVLTRDGQSKIHETEVGKFPEFHTQKLTSWERNNLYSKINITTEKSFVSFYFQIPLIRKYNHDLKLMSEYILKENLEYKIHNYDEVMDNDSYFFTYAKNYGNKIFVIYDKKYLLLFDETCKLLSRFLLPKEMQQCSFTFDDDYLYFLNSDKDPYQLYKVKYGK